jgi:tetratricopeptide (TPR) repeat protein
VNDDAWSSERYNREAQDLYETGAWEEARQLLRVGVAEHPENLGLRVSLAYAELACEEYAWARMAFEEVLGLDPENEDALLGLGEVMLKLDRPRAFALFDQVMSKRVETEPDLALAIGRALYRENLYDRALPFFEEALSAGRPADAAAEIAYTLYNLDRTDEAIPFLEAAVEADPEHHEARVFLGTVLYERGDLDGAIRMFGRVPPSEFWDALALWRTIELLRASKMPDPALEPYHARLKELTVDPSPEDRLLAALEAGVDIATNQRQLDLFGRPAPRPHVVHARDGRTYAGEWSDIVRAMRDDGPDPSMSMREFMSTASSIILSATGIRVPDDDPEAFIRGSERAGALRIGR